MGNTIYRQIGLVVVSILASVAFAAGFDVQRVQVEGNHIIPRETILSYVPMNKIGNPGRSLDASSFSEMVSALYATGFFENVELARAGNTLIVKVQERPAIASISFSGNSAISKDKIEKVLKDVGLAQGHVFEPSVLMKVKNGLMMAYRQQGLYQASVDVDVDQKPRHRVAIRITMHEGEKQKIKNFHITGNTHFTTNQLTKDFNLSTTKFWSFITDGDKYVKEKLAEDIETLKKYYLDRGYFAIAVNHYEAKPSADGKSLEVVIDITEGSLYRFSGATLDASLGNLTPEIAKLITIKPGQIFSQQQVLDINKKITEYLGDKSYAFTQINIEPKIDEKTKTIYLIFHLIPGKKVYVRRIDFSGNHVTRDNVLRRQFRQQEGAPMHFTKLQESLRNLRMLGYLDDVDVQTKPVVDSDDQVDLTVKVNEKPMVRANVTGGYGTNGFLFGASLNQQNFMGTGNFVGIEFNRDSFQRTYSFDYENPYYTPSGISRGFHFYSQRTTPGAVHIEDYAYNSLGGSINYRFPFSDYSGATAGFGIEKIDLSLGSNASNETRAFVANNGSNFNRGVVSLGWDYNTYDQLPFTTKGFKHSVSLDLSIPLLSHPLDYYKLDYAAHLFQPLTQKFILSLFGNVGYGASYGKTVGGLPFFKNYFAGGIDTVRGYDVNTLGPRNTPNNNPIGGNAIVNGNVSIIFPNPISENLRTSLFIDSGNVYNTRQSFSLGQLRYSTGVSAEWRLPMLGVVQFSLAKPLHSRSGDNTRVFAFTFGTNF